MNSRFWSFILSGVVVAPSIAAPVVYNNAGDNVGVVEHSSIAPSQSALDQQLVIVQKSLENMRQMNFPDKIEALQRQLQLQQGTIEVLQHKIDALQKQQTLQYQDLVKQITKSAMKVESTSASEQDTGADTELSVASVISDDVSPDEQDRRTYQSAYSLVTGHHYPEAIDAFKAYLQIYEKSGRYSANANYWLGELYAQQKHYDQAVASLTVVLKQFPDSNKVPDAMLKLGVIAIAQDNLTQAKQLLNDVIQKYAETGSARLAKQQLQQIEAG